MQIIFFSFFAHTPTPRPGWQQTKRDNHGYTYSSIIHYRPRHPVFFLFRDERRPRERETERREKDSYISLV